RPETFVLSAAEVSSTLSAAGFTYTIAWGDGTPVQAIVAKPGNGKGVALTHVFTRGGTFTVRATSIDTHAVKSQVVTTTIAVQAAIFEPDPIYPGHSLLAIGGTVGNDDIRITQIQSQRGSVISVLINGASQGSFPIPGRIAAYGGPGNDRIVIA